MDFTGSQKVKASKEIVFQSILDPEVIKNCVPGCDSAKYVDFPSGRQIELTITPPIPGFKEPHTIYLQTSDVTPPSHVVLITEPSSSFGTVKATCVVDLTSEADGTLLSYNAHADREGKVAAIPEMLIKGAVKTAIEQFFKNFEKQVSSITA